MSKKRIGLFALLAVGLYVILSQSVVSNAILSLVLAGSVVGTGIVIPFWAMMTGYTTLTALIVAWYAESLLVNRRMRKTAAKQRMPRRRYSHI